MNSAFAPDRTKRGRLGGYLPAVNYGYWSAERNDGWELCALMEPSSPYAVYIRTWRNDRRPRYYRLQPGQQLPDGKEFYAALLRLQQHWQHFFRSGMQLRISDQRVMDASRAAIALALCGYQGVHPRYGMGGYWRADDLHDGFPPTTLSMCSCLLNWGLIDPCRERLGYYFQHFVRADGTLKYYGPAVAEYGQLLNLAVTYIRQVHDDAWFEKQRQAMERIANYLLALRKKSRQTQTPDAISYGLLLGGAEADTRNDVAYYFSGSVWCWRGLTELGRLYQQWGRQHADMDLVKQGQAFVREAEALRQDIQRSVKRSVLRDTQPPFLPPIAGCQRPFKTMTQDRLASYTNYRYWLETLSACCLTPEQESMMLDYRAQHGGELLGMTRFTDHLDDWPLWHQAYSLIGHDRVGPYLLTYYAHLAHHQMPGTFTSYEQVPIRGYAYRREVADYCVPAQLTIPLMTRWMLVYEEPDADVLWLLRAIPRSWLQAELSFQRVPTRWGNVSMRVKPSLGGQRITTTIQLEMSHRPTIMLRLRHPSAQRIAACQVRGGHYQQYDTLDDTIRIIATAAEVVVTADFANAK